MAFAALDLHEKVFGEELCSNIGYWNFSQSPIKIKNVKINTNNSVKSMVNKWNDQLSPKKGAQATQHKTPFLRKKCCSEETTVSSVSSVESSPERPLTSRRPQKIIRREAFKKARLPMIRIKGQVDIEYETRKREIQNARSVKDLAGMFVN